MLFRSIDDAMLEQIVKDDQLVSPDCQYIGLVLSPKSRDPLAVVTFIVSRADLERSKTVEKNRTTFGMLKKE